MQTISACLGYKSQYFNDCLRKILLSFLRYTPSIYINILFVRQVEFLNQFLRKARWRSWFEALR